MDTSETYIKMCDCKEIQGQRSQEDVPWSTGIEITDTANFYYNKPIEVRCGGKSSRVLIWLPRQDQLQEMIWDKLWKYCSNKVSSLSWGVYNFYLHNEESPIPESMEQLWLAFVMKEKFNKTWDGEKWVSGKSTIRR